MSARRVENPPEKQALKRATAALVKAAGGVEAAEGFCRPNFRRLSEYGRVDNDTFLPADAQLDLEAVTHGQTGHPHVTRFIADQLGFVLVPKPRIGSEPSAALPALLADHVRETADVTTKLCEGLARGKIKTDEARSAVVECDEAIEALLRLKCVLERVADG